MLFMNEWDIIDAQRQLAKHPILGKATTLLYDLMTLTNEVSDGWAYWPKPCRAARQLQALIQRGIEHQRYPRDTVVITDAELRKALAPIKAFLKREAHHLRGHTLTFP